MASKRDAPFRQIGVADPGPKSYRSGTHRATTPAETVDRVRPLLRALGITRVANVTGLDRIGVPVVMVCRPNSRSIAVSQGKGPDLAAAKASGLMEAAEIHHAEHATLLLKLAGYEELRRDHPLVDVEGVARVAGRSFDPALPILWTEARDLLSEGPRWVPFELVHANYTLPPPPGSGCFEISTNGLASGNHLLEAISHGISEVIERDSTSLWHQSSKAERGRSRVDLYTVDDPPCREVLAKLERAGLSVAVWSTTTDVAVPSFYCIVMDQSDERAHPGVGAGCHPAREVALLRALTEAVQVRTTYIAGSRDDLSPAEYTDSAIAGKQRNARSLLALGEPGQSFGGLDTWQSETFQDDVCWMLERLRAVGIEQVLIVDLSQAAFRLPVVRVVIPGLEGPDDHDDYVPGARAAARRGGRP
ncbi:MAG: YcaO-like family protein [Rhodospirillales bacterium]|nr:YcaO-like family protein [Rhodospirillales bacterium]